MRRTSTPVWARPLLVFVYVLFKAVAPNQANAQPPLGSDTLSRDKELPTVVIHDHRKVVDADSRDILPARTLALRQAQGLSKALSQLPSVRLLQTGPNNFKPMLQGLYGARVLMINNGVRQEGNQWGLDHAPEIEAGSLAQLSIERGPSALKWASDAMGGVVVVTPRSILASPGLSGYFSTTFASNGRGMTQTGGLEGRFTQLKSLGFQLSGSTRNAGDLQTPDYHLNNTGVRANEFKARVGWTAKLWEAEFSASRFQNTNGILRDAHLGNVSDLEEAILRGGPQLDSGFTCQIDRPRQEVAHQILRASFHAELDSTLTLDILLALQENQRSELDLIRRSTDPTAADQTLSLSTHSANLALSKTHSEAWHTDFGVNGFYQENRFKGRFFVPNYALWTGGLFAVSSKKLSEKWVLEAGGRYDLRSQTAYFFQGETKAASVRNYGGAAASASAVYTLSTRWNFTFQLGSTWRAPSIQELYSDGVHQGLASYETGDSLLSEERAISTLIQMKLNLKRFRATLSPYLHRFSGYIYQRPTLQPVLTIRGAFPAFSTAQADLWLYGADLVAAYSLPQDFRLGLRGNFVSTATNFGQLPFLPPLRAIPSVSKRVESSRGPGFILNFEVNLELVGSASEPAFQDYAAPPSGYAFWGAEASFERKLGPGRLLAFVTADNLTNRRYRDYLNRFRYFAIEPGRNLSVGLRYSFLAYPQKRTTPQSPTQ